MNTFRLNLPCGLVLHVNLMGSECKEHANEYLWQVECGAVDVGRGFEQSFSEAWTKCRISAHTILRNSAIALHEAM